MEVLSRDYYIRMGVHRDSTGTEITSPGPLRFEKFADRIICQALHSLRTYASNLRAFPCVLVGHRFEPLQKYTLNMLAGTLFAIPSRIATS